MTDERPLDPTLPERARIEPSGPVKRLDALPILYLVGFLILASALIYLWRHPGMPHGVVQEAARVDTLRADVDQRRQELAALSDRLQRLEARPAPDLGPVENRLKAIEARPAPAVPNLGPLESRLKALEDRPAPPPPAPIDLAPLQARLKALEDKPAPPPVDLKPLEAQVKALEQKPPVDLGPLQARIKAQEDKPPPPKVDLGPLEGRMATVENQAKQNAAALSTVTEKAARAQRVISANGALEAGQRLGEIPGAPPAVARFAHDNPPTESALRLSFNQAADAARAASQPAVTGSQSFADRMWSRAQQSVTVRQGDHVIVGDPIAGVIATARQALDAGDLANAVKALEGLAPPAKAAMADWIGRAQSLLDARAGLAEMARS